MSGTGVAQASVSGNKHLVTNQSGSQLPSGATITDPPDDPTVRPSLSLPPNGRLRHRTQIVQQVRDWWKAHKGTILAAAQFVFETVEKGLDGMPIPGPKAAFGAVAGVIENVRVCSLPRYGLCLETHDT
jgi:hypothetical protein